MECKFYRPYVQNPVFRWLKTGHKLEKRQWRHNFLTWYYHQVFFDVAMFLLSSLVTGPSFMSILWRVLDSWQLLPSKFFLISGDWGKIGIPNLARLSLIKSYWILQNALVTVFTFCDSLRQNQQEGGKITPYPD